MASQLIKDRLVRVVVLLKKLVLSFLSQQLGSSL